MEKRFLMNLRHFLVFLSLLWLAGCATTTVPDSSHAANVTVHDNPLKPLTSTRTKSGKVASLTPPSDLWERIRQGFAIPDLEDEHVTRQEQWYSSRPDYIQRMTERSSKYLFHIVEELERRGMPTEQALLPYIESAFNPQAVSSAKAAGMWQFMPATGTYFDLRQNMLRDDRRDVLASTRAALDYLEKLHGMFGDWHLALAAYNWGEGSVGRAIKRNAKDGLGTGYLELTMPTETRQYVPKLQAVKNIIANPDDFNTELPNIENHPYFQVVEIQHDMDAELVARLADVHIKDFRALNPSLKQPVIFAAGTPQILLPWDNAKVFKRNLEAYDEGQYASWTIWTVPSTMTVADAAQRVEMSESDLRNINNIPPRMLIKQGSALMVPRTAKQRHNVSSKIVDYASVAFTPEIVNRRTTVRVRKADTLASVARRYKVSIAELARWNRVATSAKLRTGQSLSVYVPVAIGTEVAATSGKAKVAAKRASQERTTKKAQPTKSVKSAQASVKPVPRKVQTAKHSKR